MKKFNFSSCICFIAFIWASGASIEAFKNICLSCYYNFWIKKSAISKYYVSHIWEDRKFSFVFSIVSDVSKGKIKLQGKLSKKGVLEFTKTNL